MTYPEILEELGPLPGPMSIAKGNVIDLEFNSHGHFLRQIWREGDVAVYERSVSPEHPPHELELVIIQVQSEAKLPSGGTARCSEVYPRPSKWRQLGWSFPVRHKLWVLELGRKSTAIKKNRGAFVRQAITDFKRAEKRFWPEEFLAIPGHSPEGATVKSFMFLPKSKFAEQMEEKYPNASFSFVAKTAGIRAKPFPFRCPY